MTSIRKLMQQHLPEALEIAGESALWENKRFNGVLNNTHQEVEQFGQTVSSNVITFTCLATDVDGMAHGDKVIIDGDDYRVGDMQPNASGAMVLVLRETR